MPRPAKTLLQRVRDRSFVPSRHAELLAADDSLGQMRFHGDEPWLAYYGRLLELQLYYRHAARDDGERRECALAFRDALTEDYRRYWRLMSDPDGVPMRWVEEGGGWQLEPWPDDPGYRLGLELWQGLAELAEQGASIARQKGYVRATARRHGVSAAAAFAHVARALHD
jgi:hypothetical protein